MRTTSFFCLPLILVILMSGLSAQQEDEKEKKKQKKPTSEIKLKKDPSDKKTKGEKKFEGEGESVDLEELKKRTTVPDYLYPGRQRSEKKEKYEGEKKTLMVTNVPQSEKKHVHYQVHYILKDKKFVFPDQSSSAKRTLEIPVGRFGGDGSDSGDKSAEPVNVLGGTMLLYESYKPPERKEKQPYLKLVGYRKQISRNPVSLEKEWDVYYRKKKWVTKRINFDQIVRRENKDAMKVLEPGDLVGLKISLNLRWKILGGHVVVYQTGVKLENGSHVIYLSAPKGEYGMKFATADLWLGMNLNWPLDQSSKSR